MLHVAYLMKNNYVDVKIVFIKLRLVSYNYNLKFGKRDESQ